MGHFSSFRDAVAQQGKWPKAALMLKALILPCFIKIHARLVGEKLNVKPLISMVRPIDINGKKVQQIENILLGTKTKSLSLSLLSSVSLSLFSVFWLPTPFSTATARSENKVAYQRWGRVIFLSGEGTAVYNDTMIAARWLKKENGLSWSSATLKKFKVIFLSKQCWQRLKSLSDNQGRCLGDRRSLFTLKRFDQTLNDPVAQQMPRSKTHWCVRNFDLLILCCLCQNRAQSTLKLTVPAQSRRPIVTPSHPKSVFVELAVR